MRDCGKKMGENARMQECLNARIKEEELAIGNLRLGEDKKCNWSHLSLKVIFFPIDR
jgi:hypothetical protein